jgi:hypothetical protein
MSRRQTRTFLLSILAFVLLALHTPQLAAQTAKKADPAATAQPAKKATKPDPAAAAAVAEAKKNFEVGLKLYKEGLVKEALATFLAANKIAPRASIQRNIGQCQRDLKDFAAAHGTYSDMLDKFWETMKPAEAEAVKRALEELSMLTGSIEIKAAEPDAAVTVNGTDVGKTPFAKPLRFNIGQYTVAASKSGFEPFSKQASVQGNDTVVIDVKLEKEVLTGHLSVVANGPAEGVILTLNGTPVGPLPWEGELEPGSYQVEAKGPASAANPQRVDIVRRQKSDVLVQLFAQIGVLFVDPHNAEAEISVDGKVVGKGVWEGRLTPDRHELLVTAPLRKPYSRVLVLHVGERAVENPVLQLEEGATLHDFTGLYVGFDLGGRFGTKTKYGIAESCPALVGSCDSGKPVGFDARLRIGYNFGWLGAEVFGLANGDFASASANYSAYTVQSTGNVFRGRQEDYSFDRFGGGAGLGVRATSKHTVIRFTGGAGLGVAYRKMGSRVEAQTTVPPNATCTFNCQDESRSMGWSSSTSKTIPMLLLDAGLLLGSTPGTKFKLGAMMAFEFYGDAAVTEPQGAETANGVVVPRPGMQVARGTEIFFGPVIGLQFGE